MSSSRSRNRLRATDDLSSRSLAAASAATRAEAGGGAPSAIPLCTDGLG